MLSLLGQRWHLNQTGWREAAALSQQTGLAPIVCQLLAGQGVTTPTAATAFLSPRLPDLPDPALMPDVQPAVARLATAIKNAEALCIFGDYDVDGTCATTVALKYLRALGLSPTTYTPDRLTEGYGPNPEAMRRIAATGIKLILTVDTGTMAHEALEEAKNLGLDVIVTDHHPPHGERPACLALVNPHAGSAPPELAVLSGTGVLFYLLMALNKKLREEGFFTAPGESGRPEPKLTPLLDLVATATVCDVMPLTGVNRILVAKGLAQLGTWQNAGLLALAEAAGSKDTPDTYMLGFQLGPRLNAAGRIESAQLALNLLQETDPATAAKAAAKLHDLNLERQALERKAVKEALAQAEDLMAANPPVLMVQGPWHPGVVGLVASRVKEKFYRPTFALAQTPANAGPSEARSGARAEEGEMILKGSARSIEGVNLGAAVAAASVHTLSGGGHAMAAGVTLTRANFPAFQASVLEHITQQLATQPDALTPLLTLAAHLPAQAASDELMASLNQLQPFGTGNPEPTLALTGSSISYAKPVGTTQEHIRFTLTTGSSGIAFGAALTPLGKALTQSAGKPQTLAVKLRQNTWQGRTTTDLHLQDIHETFTP